MFPKQPSGNSMMEHPKQITTCCSIHCIHRCVSCSMSLLGFSEVLQYFSAEKCRTAVSGSNHNSSGKHGTSQASNSKLRQHDNVATSHDESNAISAEISISQYQLISTHKYIYIWHMYTVSNLIVFKGLPRSSTTSDVEGTIITESSAWQSGSH